MRVYVDGEPAELEVVRDGLTKDITYGGGEPDLAIGYRFRDNGFKGGPVDEFRVFNRALTPLEVAQLAGRRWRTLAARRRPRPRSATACSTTSSPTVDAAHREAGRASCTRCAASESRLVNPIPEIMVMKELPQPKPAFVLKRGAYDAPGEPVSRGHAGRRCPPFPTDQPRNRLGLARWLLAPEHPLTARVTVNRLWQMMFGRGIVETSDNFGSQGAQPTHPELLDWLAREFVDSGWDVKRLLRLIATSATYRQSSQAAPELLARDPDNELLARGPARRLTAEMLRDQALAASGLLVERSAGRASSRTSRTGSGKSRWASPSTTRRRAPDLYRRSLYTFWKRTVPPPAMIDLRRRRPERLHRRAGRARARRSRPWCC